ncbi:MAG: hypothetical protein IKQ77_06155 [Prevotella sp.]|nr:hypothetical protein [Prevotella sp.]
MYHGFDLSDGIGVDVQQAVYDSQFLFRLGALPHPDPVAVSISAVTTACAKAIRMISLHRMLGYFFSFNR